VTVTTCRPSRIVASPKLVRIRHNNSANRHLSVVELLPHCLEARVVETEVGYVLVVPKSTDILDDFAEERIVKSQVLITVVRTVLELGGDLAVDYLRTHVTVELPRV